MPSTMRLEEQGDLFPHASPQTVEAYGERLARRIHRVADHCSTADCLRLLGELALVEVQLDKIQRVRQFSAGLVARMPPGIAGSTPAESTPRVYADPWGQPAARWRSAGTWSRSSGA